MREPWEMAGHGPEKTGERPDQGGGRQETWVQVHLFPALDFAPGAYVMTRLD